MKNSISSFVFVLVFVFLLPLSDVFAASGLYSAEAPIKDATPEARKAAIRQAFEKVLVKASGHRNIAGRSAMKTLQKQAEDYVQQFRYRNQAAETEGEPDKRLMWVSFEKSAIQRALRELGLSVWEKGRPEVLLWLAVERDGRRALLDPEQESSLVEAMNSAAERRGMPLLLPIMDLEDQAALRVSDVWTLDQEQIRNASARYGDQLVLVGRLRENANTVKVKWTLLLPEKQQAFSSSADTAEQALREGIDKVMDWLADQYVPGVDGDEVEKVKIRFLDVDSLAAYARLMKLLESLDVVSEFFILESSADQLLIEARVQGGRDILQQRLSLEGALTPAVSVPDEEPGASVGMELTYRLR